MATIFIQFILLINLICTLPSNHRMDQSTFDSSIYNQMNESQSDKIISVLHNIAIGLREVKTVIATAFSTINTSISRMQEEILSVIKESDQDVPPPSSSPQIQEITSLQVTNQAAGSPSQLIRREQGNLQINRQFGHFKIQHTQEREEENTVAQNKRITSLESSSPHEKEKANPIITNEFKRQFPSCAFEGQFSQGQTNEKEKGPFSVIYPSPSSLKNLRQYSQISIGKQVRQQESIHSKAEKLSNLEVPLKNAVQLPSSQTTDSASLNEFIRASYAVIDTIKSSEWDFHMKLQAFSLLRNEVTARLKQHPFKYDLKKLLWNVVAANGLLFCKKKRIVEN